MSNEGAKRNSTMFLLSCNNAFGWSFKWCRLLGLLLVRYVIDFVGSCNHGFRSLVVCLVLHFVGSIRSNMNSLMLVSIWSWTDLVSFLDDAVYVFSVGSLYYLFLMMGEEYLDLFSGIEFTRRSLSICFFISFPR